MALKVIDEINSRLKCLYRKNKFLTPALRRLLWNALSPHFDYALSFWYPNLTQKMKNKSKSRKIYTFGLVCSSTKWPISLKTNLRLFWLPVKDIQWIDKFSCFQISYQRMPQLSEWSFWISMSKQFKSKK